MLKLAAKKKGSIRSWVNMFALIGKNDIDASKAGKYERKTDCIPHEITPKRKTVGLMFPQSNNFIPGHFMRSFARSGNG
jgi:hypothetical protein